MNFTPTSLSYAVHLDLSLPLLQLTAEIVRSEEQDEAASTAVGGTEKWNPYSSTSLSVVPTWPSIQAKVITQRRLKYEWQLMQISSMSGQRVSGMYGLYCAQYVHGVNYPGGRPHSLRGLTEASSSAATKLQTV